MRSSPGIPPPTSQPINYPQIIMWVRHSAKPLVKSFISLSASLLHGRAWLLWRSRAELLLCSSQSAVCFFPSTFFSVNLLTFKACLLLFFAHLAVQVGHNSHFPIQPRRFAAPGLGEPGVPGPFSSSKANSKGHFEGTHVF